MAQTGCDLHQGAGLARFSPENQTKKAITDLNIAYRYFKGQQNKLHASII